jgi:hypothetical protein
MKLRIRPKSDFLHKASVEQLYILTEHWKSDIEFYGDESRFLHRLINKYFIWLIKDGNINNVQYLSNKLDKMIKQKKEIYKRINKHLRHFEEIIGNSFSHDENKFRDEHEILEDQISEFVKGFWKLKKEIFSVTEHVIEEEKIKHLIISS